ncbi:unnamed protein product [Symbiodinium necroappetens]|uniref:Uncharacterized protein n=1 Tax=Symbiodinium necroappetens TaxID=1628268 RepID=A0A813A4P5_9DINO|nr:unnamed protein product [Symbiodinium necroappetens]
MTTLSMFRPLILLILMTMPPFHKAMERVVDGLNVVWFGAAAGTFVLGARGFTRRNLLRSAPSPDAVTEVAVYTMRFLGGMNAGWMLLFLLKLLGKQGLGEGAAVQYLAAALAHFSQWLFNTRLATGTAPRQLHVRFSKEMRFIFLTDFAMALLNLRQGFASNRGSLRAAGNGAVLDTRLFAFGSDSAKLESPEGKEMLLGEVSSSGLDVELRLPPNSRIPEGATHLLVFSRNAYGERGPQDLELHTETT